MSDQAKRPKVLPCPFCGSERVEPESAPDPFDPRPIWWAECQACGAQGPPASGVGQAMADWNSRA